MDELKTNLTSFQIIRQGSRTYFYSSLFFPKAMRQDVFTLYAFVRTIDNFIDKIPQDQTGFLHYRQFFEQGWSRKSSPNPIIHNFIELSQRKNFEESWITAFLESMEQDLTKKNYADIDETESYIYGSAVVIGYMMAKIMNLQQTSLEYAGYLGKSMQYLNFIRDIAHDLELGRQYLPEDEIQQTGLSSLSPKEARNKPQNFKAFIEQQLARYFTWQEQAENGFRYLPKRLLIPIKTASDMYKWTAFQIQKQPKTIYQRQLKPTPAKIVIQGLRNSLISLSARSYK